MDVLAFMPIEPVNQPIAPLAHSSGLQVLAAVYVIYRLIGLQPFGLRSDIVLPATYRMQRLQA
jgi:hypothetical protein